MPFKIHIFQKECFFFNKNILNGLSINYRTPHTHQHCLSPVSIVIPPDLCVSLEDWVEFTFDYNKSMSFTNNYISKGWMLFNKFELNGPYIT